MKKIVWKKVEDKFSLAGKTYLLNILAKKQIGQAIGFLRRNFPELRGSYYAHYLERRYYLAEVALLERWQKDCRSRRTFCCCLTEEKTGKIIALMAGSKEHDLPMIVSNVAAVSTDHRNQRIFDLMYKACLKSVAAAGIEHVVCVASSLTQAAQRVYLNAGLKVCAVVPGGDLIRVRGREYYVPDVYFYGFLGRGHKKKIPQKYLRLEPEVKKVFTSIRRNRSRNRTRVTT